MRVFIILSILSLHLFAKTSCEVTRAGIDIGSGTTKLKVAKVDLCLQKVLSILHEANIPVGYKEDLKGSNSNELSLNIFKRGLQAIQNLKSQALRFGADSDSVYAVATSAFRTASNGKLWARRLALSSGIEIKVISQKEEALIGFVGAISKSELPSRSTVVWDIGGGSMQLTSFSGNNNFNIYEGKLAAVSFKNHILSEIQNTPLLDTPNPISLSDRSIALRDAQVVAKVTVDKSLKEKIKKSSVVGIGGVHFFSILKNISDKSYYTLEDIERRLNETIGLTDDQIGGEYAKTDISNLILVKGFMQALGISRVKAIQVNLVEGILVNPSLVTDGSSI